MFSNTPVTRQVFSVLCGNLLTLSFGATIGWAAVNFVTLQKEDTTFPSGPLTLTQATRVVSLFLASGAIGNLVFPYIVKKIGSKRTLFALGFPQLISWLLIVYAQNPYYLYASRCLSGLVSGGLFISLGLFLMEISNDGIRGTLMSIFDPFMNIGMLISFLLGKYFTYAEQAWYQMVPIIAFLILFAIIPESPPHLMDMKKEKAANKANIFFKGIEIEKTPATVVDKSAVDDTSLSLSDFTNHRARKAIFIAYSLVILTVLQGSYVVLSYMSDIFEKSNPNMSSIDSSIVITGILLLANFVYVNLIDRGNRRTFFVYSALATTFGHIAFAFYLNFLADDKAYDWVPIVVMSFTVFAGSLGLITVPWLMMLEVLPKKIKNYAYSGCLLLYLIIQFILSELYPPILERFGLIGWILFFASACIWNALFGIFFMPETKGKSHEEIMELLD